MFIIGWLKMLHNPVTSSSYQFDTNLGPEFQALGLFGTLDDERLEVGGKTKTATTRTPCPI